MSVQPHVSAPASPAIAEDRAAAAPATFPFADAGVVTQLRQALLLLGVWTLPGLLSTVLVHSQSPAGQSLVKSLASQVPPWWFWAPVTPLIFRLGRRFPLRRGTFARSVLAHLLVSVVVSCGALAVALVSCEATEVGVCNGRWPFAVALQKMAVYYAELNLGIYCVVLAAGVAFESTRRAREEELRAVSLEGMLASAQLQALKMQLHPHFLFNTLHAVGVLVRKGDQEGALRVLSAISDLLRMALAASGRQLVPLHAELEFLERYLDVERTRFRDRLTVKLDVDPAARAAKIPNLILQPIVENAVRHGLESRAEPGMVEIVARRAGSILRVTVRDDGPGLGGPGVRPGSGIGLANVRARLEQLYPVPPVFTVENVPEGRGVLVTLEIPFLEGSDG